MHKCVLGITCTTTLYVTYKYTKPKPVIIVTKEYPLIGKVVIKNDIHGSMFVHKVSMINQQDNSLYTIHFGNTSNIKVDNLASSEIAIIKPTPTDRYTMHCVDEFHYDVVKNKTKFIVEVGYRKDFPLSLLKEKHTLCIDHDFMLSINDSKDTLL